MCDSQALLSSIGPRSILYSGAIGAASMLKDYQNHSKIKFARVAVVAVAIIAAGAALNVSSAEAQARDICGNPAILETLKLLVAGKSDGYQGGDKTIILRSIIVSITNQSSDETGLHVTCSATIHVPEPDLEKLKNAGSDHDSRVEAVKQQLEQMEGNAAAIRFLVTQTEDHRQFSVGLYDDDTSGFAFQNVRSQVKRLIQPIQPRSYAPAPSAAEATHTLPPYPPLSQRMGEQGTTILTVTIGTDGKPIKVELSKSSGSANLDKAAIDWVGANWRWDPPTQEGRAATASTEVAVDWAMK
jgi:TonB family protein